MATTAAFTVQPTRSKVSYVPWLPLVFGVAAIICTGVWHHYCSLALYDTKVIAALISLQTPRAFTSVLPSVMSASVALVVIFVILSWAVYLFRALQQYKYSSTSSHSDRNQHLKLLVITSGIANALMYVLAVWFMVMFALSLLWAGGGMIAAKATMDGANTLTVVDDTLPKLIKTAVGIDPAKTGYLVHVAGRDVNIGTSSCSLFCFTLARAMLADTIDCTCNAELAEQLMPAARKTADITDTTTCQATPVMCSINAYAYTLFHSHMKPAVVAIVIGTLCVLALLMLMSGMFSRVLAEQKSGYISRCSSADVHMRVEGDSSPGVTPKKGAEV